MWLELLDNELGAAFEWKKIRRRVALVLMEQSARCDGLIASADVSRYKYLHNLVNRNGVHLNVDVIKSRFEFELKTKTFN